MSKKQTPKRPVTPQPAKETKEATTSSSKYLFEILLFVGALLLYSQAFNLGYALDDPIVTINNRFVQQGLDGIPDLVTKGSTFGLDSKNTGTYRPLTLVTFAVEHAFYGNSTKVSHGLNVLLYALTAVVVFRLLRYFFPRAGKLYLFLATLLFIAHPIHTEVVANIKSRDEIMGFLFGSLAFLFAFRYIAEKRNALLYWSLAFLALGCFSKESAVMFAIAIPIGLYFFSQEKLAAVFKMVAMYISVVAIYLIARNLVLDETVGDMEVMNNSLAGASSLSARYITAFKILGKYLLLLIFPLHLSSDYSYNQIPISTFSDPFAIISIILYIALLCFSFVTFKRKNILSYSFIFYILLLLPASNLLVMIASTMGERFLYAPSFGFSLALVAGISMATGNGANLAIERNKNLFIGVISVICFLYAIRTWDRIPAWQDSFTLAAADVKIAPNSARLHLSLGKSYAAKGEESQDLAKKNEYLTSALQEYRNALGIYPQLVEAWYNYGYLNGLFQREDTAYYAYQQTVKLDSTYRQAYNNMGVIHFTRKEYELALPLFKKSVQVDPKFVEGMGNLGATYQNMGNNEEAIKWYQAALAINPDLQFIKNNLKVLGR